MENQHQQPIRGTDREQIHDDCLRRDHDRPERKQQQEGETQDKRENDRRGSIDDVVVVGVKGGPTADVDFRMSAAECGWNQVVAEMPDSVDGGGRGAVGLERCLKQC